MDSTQTSIGDQIANSLQTKRDKNAMRLKNTSLRRNLTGSLSRGIVGSLSSLNMLATGLTPNKSHEVEKKCHLLITFFCDSYDRKAYTHQVRHNLSKFLNTAEKVKLKVGRNALTITDRTLLQNKLERIPNSLIVDAHVDKESPKLCYFVNESLNDRYRVMAFLSKTPDDSHKLVSNCQCRNKMLDWYGRHHGGSEMSLNKTQRNSNYHKHSMDRIKDYGDDISYSVSNQRATKQISSSHSNQKSSISHGNKLKDKRPVMNFSTAMYHYDSDSSGASRGLSTLRRDSDGIARVVIGGNDRTSRMNGLTIVNSSDEESTLHRVTKPRYKSRMDKRSHVRPNGDGSNSPTPHVEEDFEFISGDNDMNYSLSMKPGKKGIYRKNNIDANHGLNMVKLASPNSNRRRQGPYRSIREYEEAQRINTVSSSGLQATYGSENIAPQMALVLKGNEYVIQESAQRSRENKVGRNQTTNQSSGLRLIDGNFGQPNWRSLSASQTQNKNRIQLRSDTYLRPQQLSNQLQVYKPQSVAQSLRGQPKYRVKTRGGGENYLKNESAEYDDDHRYYRQHGQRVKRTKDGGEQLFLDKRLAETSDVIGDQVVTGVHSQKMQSGESVGVNHRSRFRSEKRFSHQTTKPANMHMPITLYQTQNIGAVQSGPHGRKNSHPVQVTTHQWPQVINFEEPDMHMPGLNFHNPNSMNFNFHNNVRAFPTEQPLQRFFRPTHDLRSGPSFNPGFQRFFQSIDNFGPLSQNHKMLVESSSDEKEPADPNVAMVTVPSHPNSPAMESPSDNDSQTSSIRSSASAYWPPELKFASTGDESDAVSWKFHKPGIKLRRKSPADALRAK